MFNGIVKIRNNEIQLKLIYDFYVIININLLVWFKCDWSFDYFFKWREFIKIEYSLFYIFMVFFVYDFDIF